VHVCEFGLARPGYDSAPDLYIGPSRYGTLEILVDKVPPRGLVVFHVMPLRESTRQKAGYDEEQP